MTDTIFLVMGRQSSAKRWAMENRLSPQQWRHLDQRGEALRGIEGPWRNAESRVILVHVYGEPGYYPTETIDLILARGFKL